jgi:hypothetical protein
LTAFFISLPITAAGVVNVVTNPTFMSAAKADGIKKLQNISTGDYLFHFSLLKENVFSRLSLPQTQAR